MTTITRQIENNICTLTFDREGSSANTFDPIALDALEEHIAFLEQQKELKGVVLISAKESVFIAGADLKHVQTLDEKELRTFIVRGQQIFTRFRNLNMHKVCAIHGACMGGGYEFALACDYRIASPDKPTKIGLPEVNLGIVPAWGGCTYLPRLIGCAKALDVILGGKTPSAASAKKLGMIDDIAPKDALHAAAIKAIERKAKSEHVSLALHGVLALALKPMVHAQVMKKKRGHYPAAFEALDVVCSGLHHSAEVSLSHECEAILRLAKTSACKNLMGLFFATEKAKKPWSAGALTRNCAQRRDEMEKPEELAPSANAGEGTRAPHVAVIGAGVMGSGIAQWLAAKNMQVILRDLDAQRVGAGMARIETLLADKRIFKEKEAQEIWARITPAPAPVPLNHCDLVIEAAIEKMKLKKKIFKELDAQVGAQTILATNTSALSITELAEATLDQGRVVGIHFFNPVHKMQLVEVVVGKHTRPEVVQKTRTLVQKMGKLPVIVKDSPGFLVNRILMPYMLEAAHLFFEGATTHDIDEAMLDFGMPMGPLRLMDEVGLDVAQDVAETLGKAFGERMQQTNGVKQMIADGLLGKKVGKGFYLHEGKQAQVNPYAEKFRGEKIAGALTQKQLQKRMVHLMVEESKMCLAEGIVEDAATLNFAMVMGTGFAPFRGGPIVV